MKNDSRPPPGDFLMQKLLNLSKKGILKWQKKQHKMLRQK